MNNHIPAIHKNTKERREAKQVRKALISDAKNLSQHEGISGYSIVVWNRDCASDCSWQSTPPMMPGLVVPEYSKKTLERALRNSDVNSIIDRRVFKE